MKKLIAIAALGLSLSLPTVSSAIPVIVPMDHLRFQYGFQADESKGVETRREPSVRRRTFSVDIPHTREQALEKAEQPIYDTGQKRDFIYVFGVQIPVDRGA